MREKKDFRFRLLKGSMEESTGRFSGIAATYDNVDLGGDRIARGAFKTSIQQRPDGLPLLWQHRTDLPIGKVKIADSHAGLQADAQLIMSDPQARIAYDHLKAGTIKGLSIGYTAPNGTASYDDEGVRTLHEVKLHEISVVTFPMNESAMVTDVKALDEARSILAAAAASSDAEQIGQLRALLKDITQMLLPDDDDDDEEEEDIEDEKQATRILQQLAFELKGQRGRNPLRW